jgi:hypothetical protein
VPVEQETKKRSAKKKIEDKPDTVAAPSKRTKKEPVISETNGNDKGDEILQTDVQTAVKKRGRKAPIVEDQKVETAEPVKKRTKKEEVSEEPVEATEKKKPGRGKKAAVEKATEDVETAVPEKPAPKKGRGKTAKSDEKPVEEVAEPEKPAPKAAKGKSKKVENQETAAKSPKAKEPQKKPKEKVSKDVVDEPEEKVEPKKAKAAKKDTKSVAKSPDKSPKPAKGRATKKDDKPVEGKKFLNSIESDLSVDFDIKAKFTQKIVMWNTSGLRSCVDKGCVEYFKRENPDIICLNVSFHFY